MFIFAATSPGQNVLAFFGHPFAALLVTTLVAMLFFGFRRGLDRNQVARMATESLAPIGTLLVIMGAGGAFKQVIVDSGVGPYAGKLLVSSSISPLVSPTSWRQPCGRRRLGDSCHHHGGGIVAPLVKSIPGYAGMIVLAFVLRRDVSLHVNVRASGSSAGIGMTVRKLCVAGRS